MIPLNHGKTLLYPIVPMRMKNPTFDGLHKWLCLKRWYPNSLWSITMFPIKTVVWRPYFQTPKWFFLKSYWFFFAKDCCRLQVVDPNNFLIWRYLCTHNMHILQKTGLRQLTSSKAPWLRPKIGRFSPNSWQPWGKACSKPSSSGAFPKCPLAISGTVSYVLQQREAHEHFWKRGSPKLWCRNIEQHHLGMSSLKYIM